MCRQILRSVHPDYLSLSGMKQCIWVEFCCIDQSSGTACMIGKEKYQANCFLHLGILYEITVLDQKSWFLIENQNTWKHPWAYADSCSEEIIAYPINMRWLLQSWWFPFVCSQVQLGTHLAQPKPKGDSGWVPRRPFVPFVDDEEEEEAEQGLVAVDEQSLVSQVNNYWTIGLTLPIL